MATKRITLNGNYICDFESTGDERQDVVLVSHILSEKGFTTDVSPDTTIFRQAHAFMAAAAQLYQRLLLMPPDASAVAPFVVNMAFSLELYFKTLAVQHGVVLHGHELKDLLKALPAAAKRIISDHIATATVSSQWAEGSGIKDISDIRLVTGDLNTAFHDWRYSHEYPDRSLRIDFKSTIFLGEILHGACQAKRRTKTPRG